MSRRFIWIGALGLAPLAMLILVLLASSVYPTMFRTDTPKPEILQESGPADGTERSPAQNGKLIELKSWHHHLDQEQNREGPRSIVPPASELEAIPPDSKKDPADQPPGLRRKSSEDNEV